MTKSEDSEPKIIVDDDWKSQVQAEKAAFKEQEALKAKEASSENESGESSENAGEAETVATEGAGAAGESRQQEFPPASFSMLVTTISAQAMTALGFFPDPSGKMEPNRSMAKHFIDTLGVLEEKTAGNLDDEEKTMLQETLHQLRMAFITPPQGS